MPDTPATFRAADELKLAINAHELMCAHINNVWRELLAMGWDDFHAEIHQPLHDARYETFRWLVKINTALREANPDA